MPYICKARALIGVPRKGGDNMFRHQMMTLTVLYISEREKGGFNQLFSKVIGPAAPFAAATQSAARPNPLGQRLKLYTGDYKATALRVGGSGVVASKAG